MVAIIITDNLSKDFDLGTVVPEKISLKLGTGLSRDTTGAIIFDPSTFDVAQLIKDNETLTSLTYDPTTATLSYSNEQGAQQPIDLSALTTDLFVQGGQFDAAALNLTLKNVDTTQPDIVVPLGTLKVTDVLSSNSIALSGTGEPGTPIKADAIVDPAPNNLLKSGSTGLIVDGAQVAPPLDVAVTDAFGKLLFEAGSFVAPVVPAE